MKKFANLVTRYPKSVLGMVLLITVYMGLGLGQLETRNNYDSELPVDDPIVKTNDRLEEIFGDKSIIIIGIERDNLFQLDTLRKIDLISEELKGVDHIIDDEIVSLSTANNIKAKDWGLEVGPFMKKLPETEAEIKQLRADLRSNQLVYGRLVSEDETFTMIIANIQKGYNQQTVHRQVSEIADKYQGPEKIYVAGDPIGSQEIDIGIQRDARLLLPLVLVLVLTGFYLCFRTARATLLPFSVSVLSILWTMGIMGHLGLPITVVSSALPVLMVAVTSSYGIHIMHRYYEEVVDKDNTAGVRSTIMQITPPILMTGITSSLGAATLLIFRVTSIRQFGIITALGILAAVVLSVTVIPALLAIMKKPEKKQRAKSLSFGDALLIWMAKFSLRRSRWILGFSVVILIVSLLGIHNIRIGNDFIKYFPAGHKLRTAFDTFNQKLGGARYLDIMIEGDSEDAIKQPDLLKQILEFQAYAEEFKGVGYTSSFANIIKHINKVMHDNDPAHDRIPDSQELIAQYLLLYSMGGNPGDFSDLVDYDYQRLKIRVMLTTSDQEEHRRLYAAFTNYIETHLDDKGVNAEFGGEAMFWLAQIRYVATGKILNILLAVAVVWLLCTIIFRSMSAGLFSIIPLTVSTVLTFGVMGFIGIRLETGTAIITAMAVGIGVDFALHYLSRFKAEVNKTGDIEESTVTTMLTSGKAILFDVMSNILGFSVFIFSGFLPIQYFGWLISLTMFTAGFGTLIMFPSLFVVFQPKFIWHRKAEKSIQNIEERERRLSGMLKSKILPVIFVLLLAFSGINSIAHAIDLSAHEVMVRNDRQRKADDEQIELTMKLINKKGKERIRRIRWVLKTDASSEMKSIIRFLSPVDVKGTGLLTIEHSGRDDDQWLYLPALRKTRRISASDQADSFMGSDFAFEDIGTEELDNYDYMILQTEIVEGVECIVIQAVPNNDNERKESGYSKRKMWIRTDNFVTTKALFFDKKAKVFKQFKASDIQQIDGTHKWRAHRMEMENLKTGHKTVLIFDVFVINTSIEDRVFTKRYLERRK